MREIMDRNMLKGLLLICFLKCIAGEVVQAQNARIKIDIERTIGEVNKHIYGNFVEHLGRCVYGGIYDTVSSLSDKKGFRTDVMTAVKELRSDYYSVPRGKFCFEL